MRKKLTIQRQTIRQLTVAQRAAVLGGAPTNTPACDPFPDIPPRIIRTVEAKCYSDMPILCTEGVR